MKDPKYSSYLIQRVGIDKIELYNFTVYSVDTEHLAELANVNIAIAPNGNGLYCRTMKNGAGILRIHVMDNKHFNELKIGCTINKDGELHEYCHLTLTVANARRYNVYSMSHAEYTEYILYVLNYISETYHIHLGGKDIQVENMEINSNIPLKGDYKDYGRVFDLFMAELLPLTFKKSFCVDSIKRNGKIKEREEETYERGNKSIGIVFYNKTRELNESGLYDSSLPKNLLRIEYKLKNRQKVSAELGTNHWFEMNDQMIVDFYTSHINSHYKKNYDKWLHRRNIDLKRLITSCRSSSSKTWHYDLLEEIRNREAINKIPFILDVEQIYTAFRQLPNENRNFERSLTALKNAQQRIENNIFLNHDLDKVTEIFAGIDTAAKTSIELLCL